MINEFHADEEEQEQDLAQQQAEQSEDVEME
mgnify:CR=1 FL=1